MFFVLLSLSLSRVQTSEVVSRDIVKAESRARVNGVRCVRAQVYIFICVHGVSQRPTSALRGGHIRFARYAIRIAPGGCCGMRVTFCAHSFSLPLLELMLYLSRFLCAPRAHTGVVYLGFLRLFLFFSRWWELNGAVVVVGFFECSFELALIASFN